jgi:uncharacterized protein (TIGR02145 family)
VKIGVSHTITYEPLLTAGGEYILTADGELILIAVRNNFPLRIPIKKACQGYYLRWYYNGYHYWFFLPGRIITNTDGEVYSTIGTRKITMGSGQVTYGQINALRTIRNARDIQLLTIDGWMNIRIEPGSVQVFNNYINGYEFDFTAIVGSREGYYSPVTDVPELPGNPHAITITHHNHGIFTMILTGHGVIIIDWGDGTPPETYTLTDVPLVITHDYTGTTGDHTITIEGEENIETLTADGQHITEITIPATATSLVELHLPNNELTDSPYIPDTVPLVIMDLLNNPLTICEVYVGSQIWMCLNYDSAFPSSKVYDDNEANRALYGGLYTYNQIKTPGFVIAGWHVPTYDEWLALITFIGGTASGGGKLKEVGVVTWDAPNTGAVDTYGFKAKGVGCWIYVFGVGMSYYNLKKYGYFWADSPAGYNYAFYCQYDSTALSLLPLVPPTDMSYAPYFSVRLLKNFSYAPAAYHGFDDYFLPSLDELDAMYDNLYLFGVGGFIASIYWCSSEQGISWARIINFSTGATSWSAKGSILRVRACRSFSDAVGAYALRDVGPAGGLIFYIDGLGTTYYEAAPSDQSAGHAWSNITGVAIGTTSIIIGEGQNNTNEIIAQAGHIDSAAKLCDDLVT